MQRSRLKGGAPWYPATRGRRTRSSSRSRRFWYRAVKQHSKQRNLTLAMTAQRNCASNGNLISPQRGLKQTERLQVCEELRHLQFFLPAARRRYYSSMALLGIALPVANSCGADAALLISTSPRCIPHGQGGIKKEEGKVKQPSTEPKQLWLRAFAAGSDFARWRSFST